MHIIAIIVTDDQAIKQLPREIVKLGGKVLGSYPEIKMLRVQISDEQVGPLQALPGIHRLYCTNPSPECHWIGPIPKQEETMVEMNPSDRVVKVKVEWKVVTEHEVRVREGETVEQAIMGYPDGYLYLNASKGPRDGALQPERYITSVEELQQYYPK